MTDSTAVVLIDPYNDFLHPDGKLYPLVKESLEDTNTVEHIKELVLGARQAGIPIYYGLHQQFKDGNYAGWQRLTPSHERTKNAKVFEEGSFGARIYEGLEPQLSNGDVVVSKHWNSCSFTNTDLNYQLKQHDITHLVFAGLTSNTCLESTARNARELGYHVTLLTDATAGFSTALKDAATELVWPLLADKVTTVQDWISSLPKSKL